MLSLLSEVPFLAPLFLGLTAPLFVPALSPEASRAFLLQLLLKSRLTTTVPSGPRSSGRCAFPRISCIGSARFLLSVALAWLGRLSARVLPQLSVQFGCLWRKRSCGLAGARLLCQSSRRHLRLVGHARERRLPWNSVASSVPAGFAEILATSLATAAGWTEQRALDPSACAKLGCSCRVGVAKNPGPRRGHPRRQGDLESRPLQSQASLFLGAILLRWLQAHVQVHAGWWGVMTLKGALGPAWELLTMGG